MLSPSHDDPNRAEELKRKAEEPDTFGKQLSAKERAERDKKMAARQAAK